MLDKHTDTCEHTYIYIKITNISSENNAYTYIIYTHRLFYLCLDDLLFRKLIYCIELLLLLMTWPVKRLLDEGERDICQKEKLVIHFSYLCVVARFILGEVCFK